MEKIKIFLFDLIIFKNNLSYKHFIWVIKIYDILLNNL